MLKGIACFFIQPIGLNFCHMFALSQTIMGSVQQIHTHTHAHSTHELWHSWLPLCNDRFAYAWKCMECDVWGSNCAVANQFVSHMGWCFSNRSENRLIHCTWQDLFHNRLLSCLLETPQQSLVLENDWIQGHTACAILPAKRELIGNNFFCWRRTQSCRCADEHTYVVSICDE